MSKGSGSGGAPANQTITNQPPQYVQNQAEKNMGVANYLASQPFPQYQGQLVAPLNDVQNAGINSAINAAGSYGPALQGAAGVDANAIAAGPAGQVGTYMSPYIQQSLMPQLQAAQQNLNQQQQQTNAQATQANAFGDARQGVQNSLNNFYGNQTMAGIEGQGFNTGYQNALNTALGEQNTLLAGGNQLANLANQTQQMGLTGANALADAGQLQQTNQQQQLNTAYQQFLNQAQYPFQMLGVQESAISNNPYSLTNNVNLPGMNPLAGGLGAFANLAGSLGSLGGGGGSSATSPFG